MPELPEVEVLVRHLRPLLLGRRIRGVEVRRAKTVRPDLPERFGQRLTGRRFVGLERRGKFIVFGLSAGAGWPVERLLGHLGMTGRLFLQPLPAPLPRHTAVVLDLGRHHLVFEDTRYFGRLTFAAARLDTLGPEPLAEDFTPADLAGALRGSRQPIKVRLLDQDALAGVGNIYASEALFVARIAPTTPAGRLGPVRVNRLWEALREVLSGAIAFGSTVPLNWAGEAGRDRLFYYGQDPAADGVHVERLRVYDRAGQPCPACGVSIRRTRLAGRSTFHCPRCQAR